MRCIFKHFRILICPLGILAFLGSMPCFAQESSQPVGYKRGYLQSIEGERERKISELNLVHKPAELNKPLLKDQIFNSKLSREFRNRYKDKFGRTEAEILVQNPNRFSTYVDNNFDDQKPVTGCAKYQPRPQRRGAAFWGIYAKTPD